MYYQIFLCIIKYRDFLITFLLFFDEVCIIIFRNKYYGEQGNG